MTFSTVLSLFNHNIQPYQYFITSQYFINKHLIEGKINNNTDSVPHERIHHWWSRIHWKPSCRQPPSQP
ncbi:MAG: hypothetical protein MUC80_04015 [Candidatus Thermoplasmatota archaeon]|nr:hypothetical protein [Candidatus Thermoplasmatota archaeon]